MASLVLSSAGSALGGALLPNGISFLGSSISGSALGSAIGSGIGSLIDQQLFAPASQNQLFEFADEGPRLSDLQVMASSEGASIPRAYGRARLAGQLIWATDFEEKIVETIVEATSSASGGGGGKGGGGGGSNSTTTRTTTTEYQYFGNFALGLCEGPITRVGRIWADGKILDLSQITYRVHTGAEDQMPDALIEAVEGSGNVPAFRGLAYIVLERLPLAQFGNRLPQLQVEIFRSLNDVENAIKAVTIVPGSTEFGYEPSPVTKTFPGGVSQPVNTNNALGGTDWKVAIDQLQETCPNLVRAGLIVSWFGDDLRAGECTVRPKVERGDTQTTPSDWSVAELTRATADTVSQIDSRPAYGGTPSDASVIAAIKDLTARGVATTFFPFIMMDIPAGNTLLDPYTGITGQPAHPWRGRITVTPAPGEVGSPDRTATAAVQVSAFFGTASVSDFTLDGATVIYTGPDEWSYRRQVLHYAHLCKAAGGVAAFLIGTELRGLTWVRSHVGHPAVDALVQLAADVKSVLGSVTKVTYAADWSEYFGHQPTDGTGDVTFHLDPLWASPHVDAIGIDNYMPVSDWRDGQSHLDALAGTPSITDIDYLKSNIAGGEGFDWFYASTADRAVQDRSPISDGSANKPWVFRYKDLVNWWSNPHYNRVGGNEVPVPTAWSPRSKPIWFTELGCPAVDRGTNQPNVFFDPKSSESHLPYASRGLRDDVIQRQFLIAHHDYWSPGGENFNEANNPVSAVYGDRMVAPDAIHVWTWDARPYPAFPQATNLWSDGANWRLGHWLTGRLGAVPLGRLVAQIMTEQGFTAFDVSGLSGIVDGFVIDRTMGARAALSPLMQAYFFEAVESEGVIRFRHRGASTSTATTDEDMAVPLGSAASPFEFVRAQETDLPAVSKLSYIEAEADYRQAAIDARRQTARSDRVAGAALPLVLRQDEAIRIAETGLQDAWIAREKASFALPPSQLALDPGDVIAVEASGRTHAMRVARIADGPFREIDAVATQQGIFGVLAAPVRESLPATPPVFGTPDIVFLDLPLLRGDEVPHAPHIAATASPWPGSVSVYRSADENGFALDSALSSPATMGVTDWDFYPGPTSRWDRGNSVQVTMVSGDLSSATQLAVLGGANIAAVGSQEAGFEIIQFQSAELVAPHTYQLSGFLRGQAGSEGQMQNPHPVGSRFVLLSGALRQAGLSLTERGLPFNWRYGPTPLDNSNPAYRTQTLAFAGIGLRPFAPAHVKAARLSSGDIQLRWIRRTRINADSWEQSDVPLGEDAEAYEVDVISAGVAVRTLSTSQPNLIYTAAQQLEDFGLLPHSLECDVFQISIAFGRGTPKRTNLNV
ncbi:glycoside hydrolase/phage tail family protein [Pyruvatibacter sp.]|uniref:baseplate multidomain protein megatron n=1 Tax=Pyruvatibacter sp. TaxID=1981328 RepID=UPI003265BE47